MHARYLTLLGAIGAALIGSSTLATSGASRGAGPGAEAPTSPVRTGISGDAIANGAIALPRRSAPPADPAPARDLALAPDPAPAPALAPAPAPDRAADPVAVDPAAAPAAALRESKPLGRPNAALSARPLAADAAPAGPLAALDPRTNEAVRVGGALVIVIGLLLLTRAGLKRAPGMLGGGGRPAGVVEILARYPVARGQSLIVLRMARRILLLHQAGTSMVTLSEVTDADEVAALLARMEAGSRNREASRFRAKLRDFEAEHDRVTAQTAAGSPGRPRDGIDRGEIVDLTRGSGRRLSLPGRRRLTA